MGTQKNAKIIECVCFFFLHLHNKTLKNCSYEESICIYSFYGIIRFMLVCSRESNSESRHDDTYGRNINGKGS